MNTAEGPLGKQIRAAFVDLDRIQQRLTEAWELSIEKGWKPGSARRSHGHTSNPLWVKPGDYPFATLYADAVKELSRASDCLLSGTDVPAGWTADRVTGFPDEPWEQGRWGTDTPTICGRVPSLREALLAVRVVSGMLSWCRDEWMFDRLGEPQRQAVVEALDHVKACLAVFKPKRGVKRDRSCVSCGRAVGDRRGSTCGACAKRESRERMVS